MRPPFRVGGLGRTRCPTPWMIALLGVLLLAVGPAAAACGSPSATTSTTASSGSSTTAALATTSSSPGAADLTPGQLGEQIGSIYVAALHDVAVLLTDKPEVTAAQSQVDQLKNDTIAKLVGLGRTREAMSTSDRAQVDAKITAALSAAGAEDWYDTYMEVWQHYSSVDREFANVVAAFNTIGQYANFDLLKQQAPEEATRLGIQ
jgi:hypothetical protein